MTGTPFKLNSHFLWGTATSSYQVEGNNLNNDWYFWQEKGLVPVCGDSCQHLLRFKDDLDIIKNLSQNAYRFSIEWSRVQPQINSWDEKAIEEYRNILLSLRDSNITPMVTLWHFTLPMWFLEKGGWENKENVDYFLEYVKRIVSEFSEFVDTWVTLNEPLVYVYNSYLEGIWPLGKKSISLSLKVLKNISYAHVKAYKIIHDIYKQKELSDPQVGIAKHFIFFRPCKHKNFGQNNIFTFLREFVFNYHLINFLNGKKSLDYIGVNYYRTMFVKASFKGVLGQECSDKHHLLKKNTLGWFIYPQGLLNILLKLKKYNLPLFITENGTSENKDQDYKDFLKNHIDMVIKARSLGVDLRGYFWWSLLDNYEWDKGYQHKFGLVSCDHNQRLIKPFALYYKYICLKGGIC